MHLVFVMPWPRMLDKASPSDNDWLKLLQSDWFQNLSHKMSDDSFWSWMLFFSFVGKTVIENKFGLAIYDLDWPISKAIRPNVWLVSKIILNTAEQQYLPLLGCMVIAHDIGPIAQLPDSIK